MSDQIIFCKILANCQEELRSAIEELGGKASEGSQITSPVRLILERSLQFGLQNMEAIIDQLNKGRKLQGMILTRPFLELAARVRWASREEGWQRLQTYWARELVKWAQRLEQFQSSPQMHQLGQEIKQQFEPVIRRGHSCQPDLNTVLKDLEGEGNDRRTSSYLGLYSIMSFAVHGHVAGLSGAIGAWLLVVANVYGTYMLVKAVRHALGVPFSESDEERFLGLVSAVRESD